MSCHSNETRLPITNLPNIAQLQGTPHHSPKLHPGQCSIVGMRRGTGRPTHRQDTQTDLASIHFASAMLRAKCNTQKLHESNKVGSTLLYTE